ncbi:hypothetical protein [Halosolutus halophilus]|uniref:hypothetical protein n=1 Tax=Halosolutus halophilus TaxID=1552990 RepID=UPI002234FED2|nr:hypothetical protein [Halosolutus halophilus]
MGYEIPSLQAATGVVFAYLMYVVAATAYREVFFLFLFSGMLIIFGLYITAHGLFTGIETAVNGQSANNRSVETR